MSNILIVGGAGFIGTHLAKKLEKNKLNKIYILDSFVSSVHKNKTPSNFSKNVTVIKDRAKNIYKYSFITNINYIYYLPSYTGTAESMYSVGKYYDYNVQDMAIFLECIGTIVHKMKLKKIILSSSRSIYGEGAYSVNKKLIKNYDNYKAGKFDFYYDGKIIKHTSTKENFTPNPISIYAATKLAQENLLSIFCDSKNIEHIIFRFQNVYGPGQSINNPYTGVISIFYNLMRNDKNINIYEDGKQSRDFVYIDDVIKVLVKSLKINTKNILINIGTGKSTSILKIAKIIKDITKSKSIISVSGNYRIGDIRHARADLKILFREFGKINFVNINTGILNFHEYQKNFLIKSIDKDLIKSERELKDSGLFS